MSNKSLLVAQREYVENLRTKAFWIGIIFFPVIIVLSIVVPHWLEKTKDVRKYTVIDNSGFLYEAVKKRAAMPDLEKVLTKAVQLYREKDQALDEFPEAIRELAAAIGEGGLEVLKQQFGAALDEDELDLPAKEFEKRIIAKFAEGYAELDPVKFTAMLERLPEEQRAQLAKYGEPIREWYRNLPSDEARAYGSRLSKSQYEHVAIAAEGDDLLGKLNQMVANEELFAYFVVNPDPVKSSDGSKYVSNNLTDDDLVKWFERFATDEVRERRLDEEAIDKETAAWIQSPVKFEEKKVGAGGKEEEVKDEDTLRQWAPVAFVYFLWMAVFSISQMLLTNTIEEKSNRILEVLLSSVSPLQLMTGKIIGIAWTGLTMVLTWVLSLVVLVKYLPGLLGMRGDIDLAVIAQDPALLTSFVVYFLLGYLFFAALLVGIGSVCNTVKEANNLMMPVTVMLMLPLLAMVPVGKDPNGTLAVFLSYVPPFTPFVMMNRAAGPPTPMEYVVTTALLVASIAFVFWAAAKVFRIGILMTGKPPTPWEILHWIRAPIGQVPVREED